MTHTTRVDDRRGGGRAWRIALVLAVVLLVRAALPAAAEARSVAIDNAAYHPDRSDTALVAMVARLDTVSAPFVDSCGAGTVCLTIDRRLLLEVDKHTITSSHVFRVTDPEGSPAVTRRLQFPGSTRLEKAATWVLRDGRIIRHGSGSAMIIKGGKDKPTEVVIAVPDVRAGDVVGWSYVYRMDYMYPGDTWYMADVVPTRRATLHMVADDKVTYRTFGGNLREGSWRCIVLGKNTTGVDSKVYWTMQDIEGVDDGPLAPPGPAILPSVQVSYTGHYSGKRWHYIRNWNDVAYTIDAWFSYVLAEDIEIRKTAVRATAGLTDPLERLDALRRFVRDRIVLMDSGDVPAGVETAADVLRQRSADGFMAGMLLFAMAHELGLPVRPILARSIDAGPFDDSLHGRLLFSDLLVESLDHPGVYFSAVGEPGPNHELPYHLLGARAMWVQSGLQEKVRAIDEAAWQAGKSHSMDRYYEEFQQRVSAQKWHTMFTLPGDARDKQGEIAETVTWTAGSDTLVVGLRATGHLDRLDLSPGAPRSSADLSQYCQWRFPEATLVDTATTDSGFRLGRLAVSPPAPEGATWTIPPAFMYGNRFLPEWEPGETTQLFCPASRDQVRTWRMAIPEGWTLATGPTAVSVDLPRLKALATASITDGALVVERRWEWRRGMVVRTGIEPLSEAIAAIRAFEMTPIVLIRE